MMSLPFFYNNRVRRDLFLKSACIHPYQIPKLDKIVLSAGVSQDSLITEKLLSFMLAFQLIGGQKSKITRSKKSIATFKIRQDDPLGCKLTLRKKKMFSFLMVCIYLIFPNMRNWDGFHFRFSGKPLNKKTKNCSFSFGCTEFELFPQLQQHYMLFQSVKGFNMTMVISISQKNLLQSFLTSFRIPLVK